MPRNTGRKNGAYQRTERERQAVYARDRVPRRTRYLLALLAFVVIARVGAPWWCSRQANAWYAGQMVAQQQLGDGLRRWVESGVGLGDFSTGSRRFDGEWLFGFYMMAGMGFGQVAREHPELRQRNLATMNRCIKRMLDTDVRLFDRKAWGEDPIDDLGGDQDHAAYLGYLNLLLSLHRTLDPSSEFTPLNERITAFLVGRLQQSPLLLLQSYPGEVYPVDNAAVAGSIALYGQATGRTYDALLRKWSTRLQRNYVDPKTGLLIQAVNARTGKWSDAPRGSGTTLATYFVGFVNRALSRTLYQAARAELFTTYGGFGVLREYASTYSAGRGDIDSGPIVFGIGLSASGFMLAGSRMHNDREVFSKLYRTVHLFGAPLVRGGKTEFVTGGPLGNAIMFAMLTAPRGGR